MKICSCCKTEKPIEEFYNACGKCKKCVIVCNKAYAAANANAVQAYQKAYHAANYLANKHDILTANKAWRAANLEKSRAYHSNHRKKQYHYDRNFKLRCNLSGRIVAALKGDNKSARTLKLLGCSLEFLRGHLEKQFQPGMTWENHSKWGWHVDHIKPCAKFDLADPAQQRECFHYTNLQPLWAKDNHSKGAKWEERA